MRFLLFKFKLLICLYDSVLYSLYKSFLPIEFYNALIDNYDSLYNSVVDIKSYIASKGAYYEKKDGCPEGQKDFSNHG